MPVAYTSASMPPSALAASSTARAQSGGEVTSQLDRERAVAGLGDGGSSSSRRRAANATRAPARLAARPTSRPTPLDPPITRMRRPLRSYWTPTARNSTGYAPCGADPVRIDVAMPIFRLGREIAFPHPEESDPSGLLAVGGDLSPERLLLAYATGIFPWYSEDQPILWHSPDPRAVLRPADLHVPRSLAKTLRRGRFEVRLDTAFAAVIRGCAEVARPGGGGGTWITPDMLRRLLRAAPARVRALGGGVRRRPARRRALRRLARQHLLRRVDVRARARRVEGRVRHARAAARSAGASS